jgi:hypothetical protein
MSNLKPKTIIIDFEISFLNSLTAIFPESSISGCTFHFGNCVWRRLQILKLDSMYKNDENFQEATRMLLNLTFVPEEKLVCEFNKANQKINPKSLKIIDDFLYYFKKTFLNIKDQKILSSKFSYTFWSARKRILNNIPRTTNCVEAWHKVLNQNLVVPHPNLGKVIEAFQKEEERIRFVLIQSSDGKILLSNKDFKKEEILRTCVQNFEYFKELGFYKAIGNNFKWVFKE